MKIRDVLNEDFAKVIAQLDPAGEMGSGYFSKVYQDARAAGHVMKVCPTIDTAYIKWGRFCAEAWQNCEYLPRIYEVVETDADELDACYLGEVSGNWTGYKAVVFVMEKLERESSEIGLGDLASFTSQLAEAVGLAAYDGDPAAIAREKGAFRFVSDLVSLDRYPSTMQAAAWVDANPGWVDAVVSARSFVSGSIFMDVKAANIMARDGATPVLTDPIARFF